MLAFSVCPEDYLSLYTWHYNVLYDLYLCTSYLRIGNNFIHKHKICVGQTSTVFTVIVGLCCGLATRIDWHYECNQVLIFKVKQHHYMKKPQVQRLKHKTLTQSNLDYTIICLLNLPLWQTLWSHIEDIQTILSL